MKVVALDPASYQGAISLRTQDLISHSAVFPLDRRCIQLIAGITPQQLGDHGIIASLNIWTSF
jgi:hypothetical protein